MVIINLLYKIIFHVILLCKEKPQHVILSEVKRSRKISIIVCLQTIIFLKEILKELEISFLLNLKIKSMTKIFFCNLCIYDTFTFVCNKSVRFLHFAIATVEMTYKGKVAVLGLDVNGK